MPTREKKNYFTYFRRIERKKNNNNRRDKANEPVTIRKIQTNKYKHLYIQIYISVVNKLLYYADTHMYVYKHVPTT